MKTLTVEIEEEIYEKLQTNRIEKGVTITFQVNDYLKRGLESEDNKNK